MQESTTQYEVRVQYAGQRDVTRFVEPDRMAAQRTAEVLFNLPATRKVSIDKLVVTNVLTWEK